MSPEEQAVTAFPDITKRERGGGNKFILVACDGIWDCLTNEACVDSLTLLINKNKITKDTCHLPVENMLDNIIAEDPFSVDAAKAAGIGTDNMTAILIYFPENNDD